MAKTKAEKITSIEEVSFFSVNRLLLSLGVKKGFPVIGKSLSAVGYSVLLRGGGGLRLFSRSVFPRFDNSGTETFRDKILKMILADKQE